MYNFTIPSQLKAWIDRILVAGETFRYSEAGPEGLAGGKRVIVAVSRGGHYAPGTPTEPLEHLETYLRAVFGFIVSGYGCWSVPKCSSAAAAYSAAAVGS